LTSALANLLHISKNNIALIKRIIAKAQQATNHEAVLGLGPVRKESSHA